MTGHRPSYLRRVVNTTTQHGYTVLLGLPENCFDHSVVQRLLEKTSRDQLIALRGNHYDVGAETSNPLQMLYQEYRCTRFFKQVYRQADATKTIDAVIVGMLDDINFFTTLFGFPFENTPMLGIVMRQHFHFEAMGIKAPPPSLLLELKRHLFKRLLNDLSENACVMTIDMTLVDYTRELHPHLAGKLRYIPDAVDDARAVTRPKLRQETGIPKGAFVILCYGSLRTVKGVQLLIDALNHLPIDVHVLLAGTQDKVIEQYLNSETVKPLRRQKRVHQVNRYIDVSEDANFFHAANIVWVGYWNYYSTSAVLIQAAQYDRPVLASENGLVGWLTHRYGIGITVNTTKQDEIVAALLMLRNETQTINEEGFSELAVMHNLRAFNTSLIGAIEHVLI